MNAQLYTKVFTGPIVREYRCYIVAGRCVDIAEKRRYTPERRQELDIEATVYTKLIRANHNGWAFCRHNWTASVDARERIKTAATTTAQYFGLGWGAVDMIASYTKPDKELIDIRVIETNSAISLLNDQATRSTLSAAWEDALR